MRYLVISDLRGCYCALVTLAKLAAFSSDDVVITLGDYVDKGPDSCRVIDWLIEYRSHARLVALRGNHDVLMLDARHCKRAMHAWLEEGGGKTLRSYTGEDEPGSLDDVPEAHWKFLESTVRYYEIDSHFFVHANADPKLPLDKQSSDMLFWEKFRDPLPHVSGKVMVCGHTSQKDFRPVNLGHAICLDTRCFDGGWLTCLDVVSGKLWQANQRGDTQTGHIGEYLRVSSR